MYITIDAQDLTSAVNKVLTAVRRAKTDAASQYIQIDAVIVCVGRVQSLPMPL